MGNRFVHSAVGNSRRTDITFVAYKKFISGDCQSLFALSVHRDLSTAKTAAARHSNCDAVFGCAGEPRQIELKFKISTLCQR